ncbi:MAG: hypothetical protein GY943_06235, partial [Chloroflexi bacterium]|nr:hypothetical protein [Chloroflexota bacterium]
MQEMVPDSHPEYDFWAGQFDLLRSVLARVAGDTAVAIRHAEKSSVLIPAVEEKYGSALVLLTHGTMALELGLSYQNAGDFANAKKYLHQSMLASQQSGNFMTMCACVFELCRIWHQQGHTKDAELLCRQMLTLSEQPNYMGWPAFFLVHIALANILLLHNQVAEANQQIQQGLALGQQSGHIYYLAHGYLIAERIQLAQNNKNAAQFAHQEAERLLAMVNINTVNLPVSAQPFSSSLAC